MKGHGISGGIKEEGNGRRPRAESVGRGRNRRDASRRREREANVDGERSRDGLRDGKRQNAAGLEGWVAGTRRDVSRVRKAKAIKIVTWL